MRIVVLDGYTLDPGDNPWDDLGNLGELEVHERTPPDLVVERARGAEILVVNKVRIAQETSEQLPDLRVIAVSAAGFDCVDVDAARRLGIVVCNVPEYGTDSVAQFVFALSLHLCHRVSEHHAAGRAGEWSTTPDFSFWKTPQIELAGKKLGIVGFGRIGRRVGEIGHALGMEILACTRREHSPPAYRPFRWTAMRDLLTEADVISLHCPLTEETQGMVDRTFLADVRPEAFLINTARGGLVNEQDLAAALEEGRLAGAAVDVVTEEPIKPDNPLLRAPNCLITPHMAWANLEARRRLMAATVENVATFLAGRPINVVS